MSEVAQVHDLHIKAVRSANPLRESIPAAAILSKDTGLNSLVGTASTKLEFEEGLMQLGNLRIDLITNSELANLGW